MATSSLGRHARRALAAIVVAGALAGGALADPRRPADPDDDLALDDPRSADARAPASGDALDPASVFRCPTRVGTTCGERGLPGVDEVVAAALAAAGLASDPSRGWNRRARMAALVPWVTVRAGRDTTWQDDDPAIGHALTYEARATWRLDRLVFDPRELEVASIVAARRRERRRLTARVIRVYFTWLRAHRATALDPRWGLHAAEAAAELDALTDGAFAAMAAPRRDASETRTSPAAR